MRVLDSQTYFDGMRETSDLVKPVLINAYEITKQRYPFLAKAIDLHLQRRVASNQLLLRPHLVRLAYELLGADGWNNWIPVMAVAELVNISTYQSNSAFDNKLVSDIPVDRINQMICSFISYADAEKIILQQRLTDNQKLEILQAINVANKCIYEGQALDLNVLTVLNLSSFETVEEFERVYLERCCLIGGSLIKMCFSIGAILGNALPQADSLIKSLLKIGELLGIGGQIVNDLGDFSPAGVTYQSAYSDLREGRLTLPIWLIARNLRPSEFGDLATKAREGIVQDDVISSVMRKLRISQTVKAYANRYYRIAKALIIECKLRPEQRQHLLWAISILRTNKFFSSFNSSEGGDPNVRG